MLIDAFTFTDELDILEARLEYLYDQVDYFVIVESNVTATAYPKPLHYLENRARFSRFKNKIIWNPFLHDSTSNDILKSDQVNHISSTIHHFNADSWVMIGDVKEIPDKQAVSFATTNLIDNVNCAVFLQRVFYTDNGLVTSSTEPCTVFTTLDNLKKRTPQWIIDNRHDQGKIPQIFNGGWKLLTSADYPLSKNLQLKDGYVAPCIDTNDLIAAEISMFSQAFLHAFFNFTPAFPLDVELQHISSAWQGHREFATWLVRYLTPECVVDLGVDYALSTFALGYDKQCKIVGIDSFEGDMHAGFRDTYGFVTAFKRKHKFDNITFVKGYFDDVAKTWTQPIDIIHIDGLHTYNAVKNDYETWKSFLKPDSVILFHDTMSFPDTVGKFFNELPLYKTNFEHSAGLGVASKNKYIIDYIREKFKLTY